MNEQTNQKEPAQVWHYSLICAEVIFHDGTEISGRRVQSVSKSEIATFPLPRIQQIQKSAVALAKATMPPGTKIEQVFEVFILNIVPLGWMTAEEYGEDSAIMGDPLPGSGPIVGADPTQLETTPTEPTEPVVHPSQMGQNISPIR